LFISSLFSACASHPSANPNTAGAYAVLNSSDAIKSVSVVDMATRKHLLSFSKAQCDSLKSALKAASVSSVSLQATPSPWEIALVIQADVDTPFVVLYYGGVLRVNASYPWTNRIADSTGAIAPGIADIFLNGDDASWLYKLMQSTMGVEPSKPYRIHRMAPLKNPN
jgi:hypothetical protein